MGATAREASWLPSSRYAGPLHEDEPCCGQQWPSNLSSRRGHPHCCTADNFGSLSFTTGTHTIEWTILCMTGDQSHSLLPLPCLI